MFREIKIGLVALSVLLTACGGGGSSTEIDLNPVLTSLQKNDGTYTFSIGEKTVYCSGYSISDYQYTRPALPNLADLTYSAYKKVNGSTTSYGYNIKITNDILGESTANQILGATFNNTTTSHMYSSSLGKRLYVVQDFATSDSGHVFRNPFIEGDFTSTGWSGTMNIQEQIGSDPTTKVYCNHRTSVTAIKK